MRLPLALAALVFLPQTALAEITEWSRIGQWEVDFYSGPKGCLAMKHFENTTFFIGFDTTENSFDLDVTLMNENWKSIRDGEDYEISVTFGDETPWPFTMTGVMYGGTPGLTIYSEAQSDAAKLFMEEFMRENNMLWRYDNIELGNFSLRNSRRALTDVMACQDSYQAAIESVSDPFSFTSTRSSDPFAQ